MLSATEIRYSSERKKKKQSTSVGNGKPSPFRLIVSVDPLFGRVGHRGVTVIFQVMRISIQQVTHRGGHSVEIHRLDHLSASLWCGRVKCSGSSVSLTAGRQ